VGVDVVELSCDVFQGVAMMRAINDRASSGKRELGALDSRCRGWIPRGAESLRTCLGSQWIGWVFGTEGFLGWDLDGGFCITGAVVGAGGGVVAWGCGMTSCAGWSGLVLALRW